MDHKTRTHNSGWSERPLFRNNQRLTPERLNRIQEHQSQRLRMALLGVAGTGVVYGFKIATDSGRQCKTSDGKIYISCGLAFDCHGRQLYWPGGWIAADGLCGEPPACAGNYTLWVYYAERRTSSDGRCGCGEEEAEWVEEGVVFSLQKECEPACDGCPDHCCDATDCVDLCDYACGRVGADDHCIPVDDCLKNLCEDPPALCAVGCGDWLYDDGAGLPLACVEICDLVQGDKGCDPRLVFCPCEPEVCQHRSYVYRNPLLYELIRGCHVDLARVKSLSFEEWLVNSEEIPLKWTDFENGIKSGLEVHFSKPIQTKTLNKTSLIFTAFVQEYETLFLDSLRIPIDRIEMLQEEDDCATGVEIHFDQDWLERQIESGKRWPSRFNVGAIIELTVRGAMLRDKCDCMLDGRPLDIPDDKPGQEMPGDDFVVAFCVAPKPHSGPKGGEEQKASSAQQQS